MVNPGFHSVPAGPERPDFGAGGASVAEVPFLGLAALTATFATMGTPTADGLASRLVYRWPLKYHQ